MNTNTNTKSRTHSASRSTLQGEDRLAARGPYWIPERCAVLKVHSRVLHARTGAPLRRPVVRGTLKLGDWAVTSGNANYLGSLAYLAQADSISYVPLYAHWDVVVEEVRDEELRAMLEYEDAAFVARVRDGFLMNPKTHLTTRR